MHWNTDGARLVGDGPGNGLADPPRGIRREFVSPAVLEFIDSLHQTDVAFLNQIEELQSPVGIFFRDRYNEPQVRLDELAFRDFGLDLALHDRLKRPLQLQCRGLGLILHRGDLRFNRADILLDGFSIFLLRVVGLALKFAEFLFQRPDSFDSGLHPAHEAQFL